MRPLNAILIVDETGRLVECNQHACDLHGYAREEIVGKDLADIIPPEQRERAMARLVHLMGARRRYGGNRR